MFRQTTVFVILSCMGSSESVTVSTPAAVLIKIYIIDGPPGIIQPQKECTVYPRFR